MTEPVLKEGMKVRNATMIRKLHVQTLAEWPVQRLVRRGERERLQIQSTMSLEQVRYLVLTELRGGASLLNMAHFNLSFWR